MLQRSTTNPDKFDQSTIRAIQPSRVDLSGTPSVPISLVRVLTVYAVTEFFAVAVTAFAIQFVYQFFVLHRSWELGAANGSAVLLAMLVVLFSLGFHNYSAVRGQERHAFLWSGLGSAALAFSAFLTILVFMQQADQYSRATLIFQAIGVGLAVAIARTVFYSWLQSAIASHRIDARRVVLIGDDPHRTAFSNRIKESGIRTVGSFSFPQSQLPNAPTAPSHQIRDLISNIRSLLPDDIIILADRTITPATLEFASILAEIPTGVHLAPIDELHILASGQISPFGRVQTIQLSYPPLSTSDLFIKRAFDVVFAFIGLVVLSPLFLVISIAVKIDSRGPVFFRQLRHGLNNEEIRVLKFRSMTCMEDGVDFRGAVENDPRVTRIGRIMRRTNIDELPQLINVLQGHMSIVGPRPHATSHNDIFNKVIAPFPRRHNVKPGITGWAQVNGYRGAADTIEKMKQRVEYDLQYIDNWSFLFDMKIIAMTFFTRRAYLNAY
jgi:Undecaprenyl-phosphate glucose phosphotransferase